MVSGVEVDVEVALGAAVKVSRPRRFHQQGRTPPASRGLPSRAGRCHLVWAGIVHQQACCPARSCSALLAAERYKLGHNPALITVRVMATATINNAAASGRPTARSRGRT